MLVETPIGNLSFSAKADGHPLDASASAFRVGEVQPRLPTGMSVTQSVAVLLSVQPQELLRNVQVTATWETELIGEGSPTSGERLDAQEWHWGGWTVVLGTEDFEALTARLPACDFREDNYPVSYNPTGLLITVPVVPAGSIATLHFIVAVNAFPEPVECSAWFAADVTHDHVLQALGGS